jgi:alkylhydroperoxidase family enzyme
MSSVTRVSVGKQTPAAYKAMTALTTEVEANATEVGLDPLLVELVKIRTSQINGCAFLPRHAYARRARWWGDR